VVKFYTGKHWLEFLFNTLETQRYLGPFLENFFKWQEENTKCMSPLFSLPLTRTGSGVNETPVSTQSSISKRNETPENTQNSERKCVETPVKPILTAVSVKVA
jgi:hypothetical protein